MLNARNEHDRSKFVEDLKESIAEMDELEQLRLEGELEKQRVGSIAASAENRDSGITDGSPSATAIRAAEPAIPSPEKAVATTSVTSRPLGASREIILNAHILVMKFSTHNKFCSPEIIVVGTHLVQSCTRML